MLNGYENLIRIFSDFLTDPEPVMQSLHHLRHRGNEIILFHVLDEAEVHFPFQGIIEFEDVEQPQRLTLDALGIRGDYLKALGEFQARWRDECHKANIDYVDQQLSLTAARSDDNSVSQ